MKIINNDIKELESHILIPSNTRGVYDLRDKIENESRKYLNNKYETKDDMVYISLYVSYLNSLGREELLDLLHFAKKLYVEKYGEKYGSIAFSNFSGGLLEDGEKYSNLMNSSNSINEYLFHELNDIYKYYEKNHKYEIGKYISICAKNIKINLQYKEGDDIYDFWETYYYPSK